MPGVRRCEAHLRNLLDSGERQRLPTRIVAKPSSRPGSAASRHASAIRVTSSPLALPISLALSPTRVAHRPGFSRQSHSPALARSVLPFTSLSSPPKLLFRVGAAVSLLLILASCESEPLGTLNPPTTCLLSAGCKDPSPAACWSTRSEFHVRRASSTEACDQPVVLKQKSGYWIAELSP
jgi:hypothetical protein